MLKIIHNFIWKINYVIHPYLRDLILLTGIWKHSGRQKFHIGFIKNTIKKTTIKKILKSNGFEKSICSWIDDNEVLSMRKREKKFQYHIRLFSDGEIRGHYEYSPEGSPIGHLLEKTFKSKKQHFYKILKKVLI